MDPGSEEKAAKLRIVENIYEEKPDDKDELGRAFTGICLAACRAGNLFHRETLQ